MTTTGQELIESAKEALAFAKGEANEWRACRIKPLFLPLKTEYFNAFKNGSKTHELRVGARWGHIYCHIGRKVILSKGYGKYERLNGMITSFEAVSVDSLSDNDYNAVKELYPYTDYINKIGIEVVK